MHYLSISIDVCFMLRWTKVYRRSWLYVLCRFSTCYRRRSLTLVMVRCFISRSFQTRKTLCISTSVDSAIVSWNFLSTTTVKTRHVPATFTVNFCNFSCLSLALPISCTCCQFELVSHWICRMKTHSTPYVDKSTIRWCMRKNIQVAKADW